jgi:predicted CoA-binding protein
MSEKKTLVIGASLKSWRFSYKAIVSLKKAGHHVLAFGLRKGMVEGIPIVTELPDDNDIHTVTMYVGPGNQKVLYNYLSELKPARVIFNPGTENEELEQIIAEKGVRVIKDCTLVMLASNIY